MDDNGGNRKPCTVEVDLRTVSFWAAGVLFLIGSLAIALLGGYACLHPDTDVHLGVWLLGMMAASAVLAAFTICGYAALAKLLTARLDAHAALSRQDMAEMRQHFEQQVSGFVDGVDHVMGFLRDALPSQDGASSGQRGPRPEDFGPESNLRPFPPQGDRDWANAN